jgi:hypothetical protein
MIREWLHRSARLGFYIIGEFEMEAGISSAVRWPSGVRHIGRFQRGIGPFRGIIVVALCGSDPEFELSPWFCLGEVMLFASSQDFYAVMGKYAGDQDETKRIRALRNDASHCGLFSACHFQH